MKPQYRGRAGARAWADDLITTINTDPFKARRIMGSYVVAFALLALVAGLVFGAGTVGLIWWWS